MVSLTTRTKKLALTPSLCLFAPNVQSTAAQKPNSTQNGLEKNGHCENDPKGKPEKLVQEKTWSIHEVFNGCNKFKI
uniref:Putative secreted protein n=1 Tax=Ixodes ricinus TaxID=34613 RepID=A0A6B0UBY3_IXORI